MNYLDNQPNSLGQIACAPMVKQTLRERLLEQKKNAEAYLSNINSALEFIDKNPGFEDFHDIVGKVGY